MLNPGWRRWPAALDIFPNHKLAPRIQCPVLVMHVRQPLAGFFLNSLLTLLFSLSKALGMHVSRVQVLLPCTALFLSFLPAEIRPGLAVSAGMEVLQLSGKPPLPAPLRACKMR